ncbi:hypothetical protein [Vibrio genomosp. F10]|uniref:HEPN AbiU2-like domain-containing protein n=1 Tax=Vibrio genomosp. F10 TaxID=723171 RepID=A0A1B9R2R3_9VIBR|nr:hypothetical protein [Vibrio genomosp. F10]OCH78452.1 hypothetical protein A6E14_17790 [Vibrio genomosp. F10]
MEHSNEEIKGRLCLWYFAVEQCCKLLDLYAREPVVAPGSYNEGEIKLVRDSSIELAIIYFCQIVNNGNSDSECVASNSREFRQQYWRPWVNFAIDDSEVSYFDETVELIKRARDQMLGHADGRAFEVEHVGPMTVAKQYRQSWKDIDIEFWTNATKSLRSSFGDYVRTIS